MSELPPDPMDSTEPPVIPEGEPPPPINPLDEMDFEEPSIPNQPTPEEAQAILEAPIGVFMYLDENGESAYVETAGETLPGVELQYPNPAEILEDQLPINEVAP